jgi:hypothetical protein
MYVGMIPMLDLATRRALIAGIYRNSRFENRPFAIESLGQRSCDRLERFEVISAEEVSMREPSPLERSLEQLHTLLTGGKVFKGHRPSNLGHCQARTTHFQGLISIAP